MAGTLNTADRCGRGPEAKTASKGSISSEKHPSTGTLDLDLVCLHFNTSYNNISGHETKQIANWLCRVWQVSRS